MVVCLSQMFILFSLSQRVNSVISWMTTNSPITFLSEHDNMVASLISNTFISELLRSTEVSLGHVWWLPSYKPHIEGDKHQEYLTKTHSNPSDFQSYIAWIQNAYSLKIKSCIDFFYPPATIQMSKNFTVKNSILPVSTNIPLLNALDSSSRRLDHICPGHHSIQSSSDLWRSMLTDWTQKQVLCGRYLKGRSNSLSISILWPWIMPDTSGC